MAILLDDLDFLVSYLKLRFQVLNLFQKVLVLELKLPFGPGLGPGQISGTLDVDLEPLPIFPQGLVSDEGFHIGLVEGESRDGFPPIPPGVGRFDVAGAQVVGDEFVDPGGSLQGPAGLDGLLGVLAFPADDPFLPLPGRGLLDGRIDFGLSTAIVFRLIHQIKYYPTISQLAEVPPSALPFRPTLRNGASPLII